MNKRGISLVMTFIIGVSVSVPVLAAPSLTELQEQQKEQEQQVQQDKKKLNEAQQKTEDLEVQVELIDMQIEELMRAISDIQDKINVTENDIVKVEEDIIIAEQDIEKEQELFDSRMKVMYVKGSSGYLEVLLSAKSIGDFLSRLNNVKNIIKYDKEIISELNEKKEQIEKKKQVLENEKTKLLTLVSENESKAEELEKVRSDQEVLVAEARKQEQIIQSQYSESNSALNQIKQKIQALRDDAPKYTPSRGAASVSSNNIVVYASNFLGRPYKWGANGPNSFDCSGFTKFVFAHFGIRLNRVSRDQARQGVYVPRSQLQPGDLVFFGSPIHHVGIYVGDNHYIHAPHTGDVVKISSMTRSDYTTGRRVR